MSAILQLVIGLVFVYSLMAILVTQINTVVSSFLQLRAKNLRDGMINLITGDQKLQAEILTHPLIKLIDPDERRKTIRLKDDEVSDVLTDGKLNAVDYVAPSTFVESLMSLIISRAYGYVQRGVNALPEENDVRRNLSTQVFAFLSTPSDEQLRVLEGELRTLKITAETDISAFEQVVQRLSDIYSEIRGRNPDLVPLLLGLRVLDKTPFSDALRMILFTAQDVKDSIKRLENWFEDAMQRTSNIFRQNLQVYSMVAAFALVLLLNVDTLAMVRAFWVDPTLRQNVADAASGFVQNTPAPIPTPSTTDDPDAPAPDSAASAAQLEQDLAAARQTVNQLLELNIPLGWTWVEADCQSSDPVQQTACQSPNNLHALLNPSNPNWVSLALGKLIGLIASAIAAAQGAPFWFDLLRKLTARS
jgi:hypothetical protein